MSRKKLIGIISVVAVSFMLFVFFSTFIGTRNIQTVDVEYSERYKELLQKESLTQEEVDYMEQEMQRVHEVAKEQLEQFRQSN